MWKGIKNNTKQVEQKQEFHTLNAIDDDQPTGSKTLPLPSNGEVEVAPTKSNSVPLKNKNGVRRSILKKGGSAGELKQRGEGSQHRPQQNEEDPTGDRSMGFDDSEPIQPIGQYSAPKICLNRASTVSTSSSIGLSKFRPKDNGPASPTGSKSVSSQSNTLKPANSNSLKINKSLSNKSSNSLQVSSIPSSNFRGLAVRNKLSNSDEDSMHRADSGGSECTQSIAFSCAGSEAVGQQASYSSQISSAANGAKTRLRSFFGGNNRKSLAGAEPENQMPIGFMLKKGRGRQSTFKDIGGLRRDLTQEAHQIQNNSLVRDLGFEGLDMGSIKQLLQDLALSLSSSWYSVPSEVLNSFVFPKFLPTLQDVYKDCERFFPELIAGSLSITMALLLVAFAFFLFASPVFSEGPLMSWYSGLLLLGLLLFVVWVVLFRWRPLMYDDDPKRGMYRYHGLKIISISLMVLVSVIAFIASSRTDSEEDAADSKWILAVLLCFKAYATMPLFDLKCLLVLVLTISAVWPVVHGALPNILEQAGCLLLGGLLIFVDARQRCLDRMRIYLEMRVREDSQDLVEVELKVLKDEMQRLVKASESIAQKHRIDSLTKEIENPEAKERIAREHARLVGLYTKFACRDGSHMSAESRMAELADMNKGFIKLRSMAEQESQRLASIMGEVHDEFAAIEDEWELVKKCPNITSPLPEKPHQLEAPAWWDQQLDQDCEIENPYEDVQSAVGLVHDQIEWYRIQAEWAKQDFTSLLSQAVQKFNEAEIPFDLGLDPEDVQQWWNDKNPTKQFDDIPFEGEMAIAGSRMVSNEIKHQCVEHGRHCALQLGPLKERGRAAAKVEEYGKKGGEAYPDLHKARYVTDWLRARVLFASPKALSLFFWYLMRRQEETGLEISLVKNKLQERPVATDTSANIHINVEFKSLHGSARHTAELQLLLENFVLAKNLEHKYYELRRAQKFVEILLPIFPDIKYAKEEKPEKQEKVYMGKTTGMKENKIEQQKQAQENALVMDMYSHVLKDVYGEELGAGNGNDPYGNAFGSEEQSGQSGRKGLSRLSELPGAGGLMGKMSSSASSSNVGKTPSLLSGLGLPSAPWSPLRSSNVNMDAINEDESEEGSNNVGPLMSNLRNISPQVSRNPTGQRMTAMCRTMTKEMSQGGASMGHMGSLASPVGSHLSTTSSNGAVKVVPIGVNRPL